MGDNQHPADTAFRDSLMLKMRLRKELKHCAPGGGFLLAPTHNIQLDVPFENIEAFYSAVEKYGNYPINL